MDSATGPSTPEPLFMDECRKKPVPSTKMAVFVDGEAWLSTIKAVYVDKWQKKWLASTLKPDSVDGATGSSMKTALYVDDSGPKAGMICLKEVDAANVANIFCCSGEYSPMWCSVRRRLSCSDFVISMPDHLIS